MLCLCIYEKTAQAEVYSLHGWPPTHKELAEFALLCRICILVAYSATKIFCCHHIADEQAEVQLFCLG